MSYIYQQNIYVLKWEAFFEKLEWLLGVDVRISTLANRKGREKSSAICTCRCQPNMAHSNRALRSGTSSYATLVETDVKVFRPWQMVMCQTETAEYISLSTSKEMRIKADVRVCT